ncbi:MAG: Hsp20/alpha crystallin family protein [Spirochaetales bacterium]|nr:Hsp20/alpha crystallin family protein [Spirochaetales bacterium]
MDTTKETRTMAKTCQAPCDIFHESDKVICKLEMPGVSKDSLEVKVDGDRLIIDGRKPAHDTKGEYRIREIRTGDYHQEFTIDDTVDRNKIDASIKNGVVTISLGLRESEKPRKIQISSS